MRKSSTYPRGYASGFLMAAALLVEPFEQPYAVAASVLALALGLDWIATPKRVFIENCHHNLLVDSRSLFHRATRIARTLGKTLSI